METALTRAYVNRRAHVCKWRISTTYVHSEYSIRMPSRKCHRTLLRAYREYSIRMHNINEVAISVFQDITMSSTRKIASNTASKTASKHQAPEIRPQRKHITPVQKALRIHSFELQNLREENDHLRHTVAYLQARIVRMKERELIAQGLPEDRAIEVAFIDSEDEEEDYDVDNSDR
jgi:hypothetical protein